MSEKELGAGKVCHCCGKRHAERGDYCAYCHDCNGTCDWFGTDDEFEKITDSLDPRVLTDGKPGQQRRGMTLKELMDKIAEAYNDLDLDDLREGYEADGKPKAPSGYGLLGAFILEEVSETFDPALSDHDQVLEVIRLIEAGRDDLERVARFLEGKVADA